MSPTRCVYITKLNNLMPVRDTLRVVSPPGYFIHGMISPDGTSVVYWGKAQGETSFNVWISPIAPRANSGKGRKLTASEGMSGQPFWSADGRHILFFSNEGVFDAADYDVARQFDLRRSPRNIWIMDADGANARRLTKGMHVEERPCISPDGRTVVFVSDRSGFLNLWKLDLASGKTEQLTQHDGLDYRPIFSPDGKRLAFFSDANPRHVQTLCIVDWPNGERIWPLPLERFEWARGPCWINGGSALLFHARTPEDGACALWVVDLASGDFHRISVPNVPRYAHGTVSDDGQWMALDGEPIV